MKKLLTIILLSVGCNWLNEPVFKTKEHLPPTCDGKRFLPIKRTVENTMQDYGNGTIAIGYKHVWVYDSSKIK